MLNNIACAAGLRKAGPVFASVADMPPLFERDRLGPVTRVWAEVDGALDVAAGLLALLKTAD